MRKVTIACIPDLLAGRGKQCEILIENDGVSPKNCHELWPCVFFPGESSTKGSCYPACLAYGQFSSIESFLIKQKKVTVDPNIIQKKVRSRSSWALVK